MIISIGAGWIIDAGCGNGLKGAFRLHIEADSIYALDDMDDNHARAAQSRFKNAN